MKKVVAAGLLALLSLSALAQDFAKTRSEFLDAVKAMDESRVRSTADAVAKSDNREAVDVYSKVAEFYSEQGFYLKAVAVYKQIQSLQGGLYANAQQQQKKALCAVADMVASSTRDTTKPPALLTAIPQISKKTRWRSGANQEAMLRFNLGASADK